jgi:acyl-coenzyme A synthetase/AMP-(fatty) acid ligase
VGEAAAHAFSAIVVNTYGSTEMGGPVMRSIGSDGAFRALDSVEVEIIDRNGRGTREDTIGELACRTSAPALGYLTAPEVLTPFVDDRGWFHTGDMASKSSDGSIRLVGRRTDVAQRGGHTVYLTELEDVIAELASVTEVAVVARSTREDYDEIAAFVVPLAGSSLDSAAIMTHCRAHLAHFKIPNSVEIRTELPHTPGGKVRKTVLAEGA